MTKLPDDPHIKSVMLARAMGELEWDDSRCRICGWPIDDGGFECTVNNCSLRPAPSVRADATPDLYAPANMSLAWRVLNWACANRGVLMCGDCYPPMHVLSETPPAEAQAAWLDPILILAIEAGLLQPEEAAA